MLWTAVAVRHHRQDDRRRPRGRLVQRVAHGVEGGNRLVGTLVAVVEVEVEAVGGGGQGGVGVRVARTIVQSGRCKCADLQV